MFFLCVYVPEEEAHTLKESLFNAGAGRIGNYQHCCWQTKGVGQFLGNANTQPSHGQPETPEHVDEIKIECLCPDTAIHSVVEALLANHPYETPAFAYWPVETQIKGQQKPSPKEKV